MDLPRNRLRAIGLLLGCALVLTPWYLRNQSQLGRGIWTTTHGGYTLLLANNPILYQHWAQSPSREWQEERFHAWWADKQAEHFQETPASEVDSDAYASALGWETIRKNPSTFIKACVIRQAWMWAWWPSQRQTSSAIRWLIGSWYALTSIAAIIGLVRLVKSNRIKRTLWTPALALALSLCVVHSVYWSNMRMRAPIIPLVSLLVGYGCSRGSFGFERSDRSR
jgi:hypothetical protein